MPSVRTKAAREGLATIQARIGEPAGSITQFFEPFERARTDISRVDQFRPCELLGLSLVRKCFGHPCVLSLSRGVSNETYHMPLNLSAMIPSRGLRRSGSSVGQPSLLRLQPELDKAADGFGAI
jgi:hypothetical protein